MTYGITNPIVDGQRTYTIHIEVRMKDKRFVIYNTEFDSTHGRQSVGGGGKWIITQNLGHTYNGLEIGFIERNYDTPDPVYAALKFLEECRECIFDTISD